MLGQSFSLLDLPTVFLLSFLEILLSADNAIILAIFAKKLPSPLQKKALYVGFFSAFLLRALALFLIAYLIHFFLVSAHRCRLFALSVYKLLVSEKKAPHSSKTCKLLENCFKN